MTTETSVTVDIPQLKGWAESEVLRLFADAEAYRWLRARILVSQISGKNIAPFAPLNRVELNPESYRQQVDEEIRKELSK